MESKSNEMIFDGAKQSSTAFCSDLASSSFQIMNESSLMPLFDCLNIDKEVNCEKEQKQNQIDKNRKNSH